MTAPRGAREFPVNVVITAMTGTLLCELGEMYEVYSFLLGRSVYTHEIPTVGRMAAPHIVALHPQLAGLDMSEVNPETARAKVKEFAERFGCSLPLTPLGWTAFADKSPQETAADIVGEDRVITVDLGGSDD